MSGSATEHAEVVFKTVLAFLWGELSVLSELVGECGRISGGGWLARVVTRVLIVLVLRFIRIARVVAGVLVAGFLVGLVFVGLVLIGLVLLRAGLLAEMLIVTVRGPPVGSHLYGLSYSIFTSSSTSILKAVHTKPSYFSFSLL